MQTLSLKSEDKNLLDTWLTDIEKLQIDKSLDVYQHSLLLCLNKNPSLYHLSPQQISLIHTLLKRSWDHLTLNKKIPFSERLPKFVLKQVPQEDARIHQSLFHEDKTLSLIQSLIRIYDDYIFRKRDLFIVFVVAMLCFSNFFLYLTVGIFVGYVFSSFMEYVVHSYIAHGGMQSRRFIKKLRFVGNDMQRFALEHSVHHALIKKSYLDGPSVQSEKLNIITNFTKKGDVKLAAYIQQSNFGLSSSNLKRTILFFSPIPLLIIFLVNSFFNFPTLSEFLICAVGFLTFSQLWIVTSSIYHPLLHLNKHQIQKVSNPLLRLFLSSRLSRFIARSHKVHHTKNGQINQNLNLFVDFFIGWADVSFKDLLEMKQQEIPF